jgi:hypothetical protein
MQHLLHQVDLAVWYTFPIYMQLWLLFTKTIKLCGLSLRANYTDRVIADCRRS